MRPLIRCLSTVCADMRMESAHTSGVTAGVTTNRVSGPESGALRAVMVLRLRANSPLCANSSLRANSPLCANSSLCANSPYMRGGMPRDRARSCFWRICRTKWGVARQGGNQKGQKRTKKDKKRTNSISSQGREEIRLHLLNSISSQGREEIRPHLLNSISSQGREEIRPRL